MACTNNPTVTINGNEAALRITFPLVLDSVNPLGNSNTNTQYNIADVLEVQITSWLSNYLRANYYKRNCDVIVVSAKEGYYLRNTYPDIFTTYTNP